MDRQLAAAPPRGHLADMAPISTPCSASARPKPSPGRGSRRALLAGLVMTCVLVGCAGLLRAPEPTAPAPWPAGVGLRTGSLPSSTGCALDWRLYRPAQPATNGLVILAHGFLRSQARLRDLALALADAGLPVATLNLCNMRPWNGSHTQNAQDLRALTTALGARRVLYAGFSAGALAALLAARSDPNAVGVLTLDLVDAGGIGARAAAGLRVPLVGLAGEPTNCNAGDNAQAVFAAQPRARRQRIPGAGHCDFESPTDRLCQRVCTDPTPTGPARRATIIALAVGEARGLLIDATPPPARR